MKTLACLMLCCGLMSWPLCGQPRYKDASLPVEERVEDLLERMTLEEKILQLNQYTLGASDNANNIEEVTARIQAGIGSLIYYEENPELRNGMQRRAMEQTRLGIPILFGYDVIHGFRTVYPISLAQACSWNTDLVREACDMAAAEARRSGVDWTFSPMIDVARDGRWGRISEGYGEDPYTNAAFCTASVEGYQGPGGCLPETLCRLRRLRGRPGLCLHRDIPPDPLGYLPAAVRGRGPGRSGYGDELVQ